MEDDIGYFQVAFSANVFSGVYLKDATAAAEVLTEFFLKKYNRDWEVKPNEVYSTLEELSKILKKQEFEVLVMPPNEYIQVKDLNLLEPIGISLRDGSPYDFYRLLVHKNSNIQALQDLNGKSVLIFCDADDPGINGARRWRDQLNEHCRHVRIYQFKGLRRDDGEPVNDLRDFLRAYIDDWEADPEVSMPVTSFLGEVLK